jgi:hypothetical protein
MPDGRGNPAPYLHGDKKNAMAMTTHRQTGTLLQAFFFFAGMAAAAAQPIPVEFVAGTRYATVNLVVKKKFTQTSRLGFFHLNTLTMDYDEETSNDLALQNLLTFDVVKNLQITGGASYATQPGFKPTMGLQYVLATKDFFLLLSPRVNIAADPGLSIFTLVRYRPRLTEKSDLFLGAQLLNIFDTKSHIKSYQWLRAGLEIKGTQFGLAFNLDEFGPAPRIQFSAGLFVRREIF